jgi:aspartate/methionine/tyrosine aminotransferase
MISDEVYALSTFDSESAKNEKFTSVLSFDTDNLIDPNLVHVLYGMSKVSFLP